MWAELDPSGSVGRSLRHTLPSFWCFDGQLQHALASRFVLSRVSLGTLEPRILPPLPAQVRIASMHQQPCLVVLCLPMSPVCLPLNIASLCVQSASVSPFYKEGQGQNLQRVTRESPVILFWPHLAKCPWALDRVWCRVLDALASPCYSEGQSHVSIHHGSLGSRCCLADREAVTDIYVQGQSQELP